MPQLIAGVRLVAVVALESQDEHFGIRVELVPGARNGLPYRDLPGQQHLTWWAADDRGQPLPRRAGQLARRRGPVQRGGRVLVGSGPRAARIELMPTSASARAVIRVPALARIL